MTPATRAPLPKDANDLPDLTERDLPLRSSRWVTWITSGFAILFAAWGISILTSVVTPQASITSGCVNTTTTGSLLGVPFRLALTAGDTSHHDAACTSPGTLSQAPPVAVLVLVTYTLLLYAFNLQYLNAFAKNVPAERHSPRGKVMEHWLDLYYGIVGRLAVGMFSLAACTIAVVIAHHSHSEGALKSAYELAIATGAFLGLTALADILASDRRRKTRQLKAWWARYAPSSKAAADKDQRIIIGVTLILYFGLSFLPLLPNVLQQPVTWVSLFAYLFLIVPPREMAKMWHQLRAKPDEWRKKRAAKKRQKQPPTRHAANATSSHTKETTTPADTNQPPTPDQDNR